MLAWLYVTFLVTCTFAGHMLPQEIVIDSHWPLCHPVNMTTSWGHDSANMKYGTITISSDVFAWWNGTMDYKIINHTGDNFPGAPFTSMV